MCWLWRAGGCSGWAAPPPSPPPPPAWPPPPPRLHLLPLGSTPSLWAPGPLPKGRPTTSSTYPP
ncbi:hypothetical protein ADH75_03165 [Flavonifractor plautii]|nr:hypothetical protein A4U99_18630 [Flavonifractor plautii]OXE48591.1 hypothetical protein ADH75_03165 [Flavonifractor plautii]